VPSGEPDRVTPGSASRAGRGDRAPLTSGTDGAGRREIGLRRARLDEADELAELMFVVRQHNIGAIPPSVHPLDDMCRWMRAVAFTTYEIWVADDRDRLVGFLALSRPDWLEHLYVHPASTGQGLGSRFVELAKQELGGAVQLWTFQSNTGAQRFYERHGFVPVEWTDGDNEERAPDVRYVFTPQ
jgi:GNAT superfamily N-acetyltransferase